MTTEKQQQPLLRAVRVDGIRWVGLTAAARRLQVSKGHLHQVLTGNRKPGPRLARGLAEMGVDTTALVLRTAPSERQRVAHLMAAMEAIVAAPKEGTVDMIRMQAQAVALSYARLRTLYAEWRKVGVAALVDGRKLLPPK